MVQIKPKVWFLADNDRGEDVFFHFSAVELEGFKDLQENQTVEYDAKASPKGLKATRVIRLSRQAA